MQEGQENENAGRVVGFLRRRGLWILLSVVLAAGAAFAFASQQTQQYTATASLIFSGSQLNQQIAGLQAAATGDPQVQQATNTESVRLGETAALEQHRSGPDCRFRRPGERRGDRQGRRGDRQESGQSQTEPGRTHRTTVTTEFNDPARPP